MSMCNKTTQSMFSSHSHICSVARAQPLALQSPPEYGEGFQKCLDPLQKSPLLHPSVQNSLQWCLQFPSSCAMASGRQQGSPSHTELMRHKRDGKWSFPSQAKGPQLWGLRTPLTAALSGDLPCWTWSLLKGEYCQGFVEFEKTDWFCLLGVS